MTPQTALMLCKLAEDRLNAIQAEIPLLNEVLRELGQQSLAGDDERAAEAKMQEITVARVAANEESARNPPGPEPPPPPPSPLAARRLELMEDHGAIYVIEPAGPVTVGQKLPYGKSPPKTVEVVEAAAHLADERGRCVANRWFVKLIDV